MTVVQWNDRQVITARLALSQLYYTTDTGSERAVIAGMLTDLPVPVYL